MASVLIDALLSNVLDYDSLFEALAWPEDSWPEKERVEALTMLVERLGPRLAQSPTNETPFTEAERHRLVGKLEWLVWTLCVPCLSRVSEEEAAAARKGPGPQDGRCRDAAAAVCRLVGACVPSCDGATAERLARFALPALQGSKGGGEEGRLDGAPSTGRLDVEVAVELVAVLLPTLSADASLGPATLTSALSCVTRQADAVVSKVAVRLLLPFLARCGGAGLRGALHLVLDRLCRWHSRGGATRRVLLCLTALSDPLFTPAEPRRAFRNPLSRQPDPRVLLQLCRVLQDGLTHRDNVSRKRALYLLKRCVAFYEEENVECPPCLPAGEVGAEVLFRWSPGRSKLLKEFWEDYALVMETLEENQIHVVRPVLNRIDVLIQTTAADSQASDTRLFHPSWLLCVYQRMFHSENKSLMREGVQHLLELQALQQPAFAVSFSQFIVGPFMDVLSESSLFHRGVRQNVGDCPELGAKLQHFLTTFFSSLPSEHRGSVLLQLIQRLASQHWCAVPILFLSQALSSLPAIPLLGTDGLHALREVLRSTMITHQVLLRGAAQCFLLHSALCLTDVSSVTLDDVFTFLVHFRADESLCRGTQLWNKLCVWLSDNEGVFKPCVGAGERDPQHGRVCDSASTRKETLKAYVCSEIHSFLQVPPSTGQTERLPDPKEADKLARTILLYLDMENTRLGRRSGSALESLLSPLLDTLGRVSTNVYQPLRKTDKSLQLMLRLFQLRGAPGCRDIEEGQEDDVVVAMEILILEVADSVQEFILRRLSSEMQEPFDVERAELYLCVLRQLVMMYRDEPQYRKQMEKTYLPKLIKNSLEVLQTPTQQIPSVACQVVKAIAMESLATVCSLMEQHGLSTKTVLICLNDYFYSGTTISSHSQLHLEHFNQTLMKPQAVGCSSDTGVQGLLQDWGRMAACFMRDQWTCLCFLTRAAVIPEYGETPSGLNTLKAALGCSVEALVLLPSDLVLPVLAFMEAVLPQASLPVVPFDEESLGVEAVTVSWELVQGLSTNPHDFWPTLKAFISMAFHPRLLQLTDTQAPMLTASLKEIAGDLMELSQSKKGVFNVLIKHCCQTWLPSGRGSGDQADIMFSSVFDHINIIAEACVYGPVFRRDQRLIQEVQTYVEQLGEECAANLVVTGDNRDNQFPRICVLAFLSHLDPSNQLHERLMEALVTQLLEKDEQISKSKVRYYGNSLQHRVKNRVWQTVLLLLPKLREGFVATLLSRVFKAGFCSNQASVKYLIEWTMILILVRYPQHLESFWACFSVDEEKTKTSICTFLSVLVHFSVIMPTLENQAAQLRKALDVILQWCFSHNFSVRLYALLALKKVWSLAEARAEAEEGMDGLEELSTVIQACLSQAEAMQSTGNANKNWSRIQEHFFFGAFHPIRDYSVETILYSFPSLSELADDEWIPPWKSEELGGFSESLSLPLRNPVDDLRQLRPGDWIQQDKGEQAKEERWAEVQKKIIPWSLGIQEQEPELMLVPQQRAARLGKRHGALLVVASLIDKPTNLGGLCRTCEIFGANALVLDSLRHVSDKHFQSLSVSSELWLPLLEVKPAELVNFLQAKKSEGYCIVGVEQTANSQRLQDHQFLEKTLLLLGNEREGIPANFLQLLDVCVEIPQQGVIRSLNVHVSAALLIWEYTRQHAASD
ncbi:probable methyltransferase TARBP1 [Lampris incognitus]|uniref:probable methyltransferase TARBP1 n=1 Tax=Lampris incognitus TaxID=2546036 RepID=UPI0024B48AA5|nr:probable methyltransferase TARBP1 [Lampris incognitus]